jgi:carbonic anhydrase
MEDLRRLFDNNRALVEQVTRDDPDFFKRKAGKQEPHFLFIGCADSRVPLETLTGVLPGEMFVHRNIANQVVPADLNLLSVLQYAVEALDVKHVIVCGHHECGGVKAAMGDAEHGLVDHWLAGIRDSIQRHRNELSLYENEQARFDRLVELNVLRQVFNLARTPIVQKAWKRGRRPILHGVVYGLKDGLLRPVVTEVDCQDRVRSMLEADRRGVGD